MTTLQTTILSTPAGAFTALHDGDGVLAAGFTTDPAALRRLLPAVRRDDPVAVETHPGAVATALAAYFAGDLAAIDDVAVAATGTAYQQRAWAALRALPPGAPVSYAQLAARTGSPTAARAAGSACGRNPTAVVVPCHRVVRGDGALGGFAWGLEAKRWLLDHERRHLASATPASPPTRPRAPVRRQPAGPRS
ncbi:MAG: methylated-DNA--[protein]-cysteine S-methyltransferase [Egibacteraceae bacterium]